MRYTVRKELWVDEQINCQLDKVCKHLQNELDSNLIAIILTGSFGRGEGSVLLSEDQTILPLKDFDLKVVVAQKVTSERWGEINASLYRVLNISDPTTGLYHFSTFNLTVDQMVTSIKNLRPDISTYDLTHSGQVLYGDDYLQRWQVDLQKVPLVSGLRFLFKKMSGLILVAGYSDLLCPPNDKARRSILYECNKTFIEIGSALCLLGDMYVPYYQARASALLRNYERVFPELTERMPDLANRVAQATHNKLVPDHLFDEDINVLQRWQEAARVLGEVLKFYLPRAVDSRNVESWEVFADSTYLAMGKRYYIPLARHLLEKYTGLSSGVLVRIVHSLFHRYIAIQRYRRPLELDYGRKASIWRLLRGYSPIIRLFTLAPLIVFSIEEEATINNERLLLALSCFKAIYPVSDVDFQLRGRALYDRCRKIYAEAFNSYHFAK